MAKQAEPVLTDENDEAVAEEKPNSKKGLFMLLAVVLLALGAGGYVAYSQYVTLATTASKVGLGGGSEEEEEKPVEYGEFLEIEGLVVNPSDSEGRRFLMVKLGLESSKAAVLEEVESKQVVVRDTVLKLLARRTVVELAAVELRTELKEELRAAVNGVLREGEVQRLYFTQYVLQ